MKTLRIRLALTHVLPVFLVLPLLGLFLIRGLEQFHTASLLEQLEHQAYLIQKLMILSPSTADSQQSVLALMETPLAISDARLVIVSPDSQIIASTHPEQADAIGLPYSDAAIVRALQGELVSGVGAEKPGDVAYVALPLTQGQSIIGALRLSYEMADVRNQYQNVRLVVLVGVALGGLLSLLVALKLAATIAAPITQLTRSAERVAAGDLQAQVHGHSYQELDILATSFNQMVQQLVESERTRGRQLSAITHELGQPLSAMRVTVETLLDGGDNDPAMRSELLSAIGDELRRLERLTSSLKSVASRRSSPLQIRRAPVQLERLIASCIALAETRARAAGIELSASLPDCLPAVNGDEDRIIQVLSNLLDNAIKYTPRGGQVTVTASPLPDAVRVSVSDSGVGFSANELPNLFHAFYRGDNRRPPEKLGMGMGLAVCRDIISAHGGRIWADGTPGQGARLTFTLPKI